MAAVERILEVKDLRSGYASSKVIRGISLEVNRGEVVALVGPNGAGKTTLMKSIISLVPVSDGKVTFREREITGMGTARIVRRGIVYVPEGISIFPGMTVEENLYLATLRARNGVRERMETILEVFSSLKGKLQMKAGQLSGGEERMLTVARGLMADPELIMLDDPFLGLSPKLVLKFCDFLRERNQAGLTILIAGQHVRRILKMSIRAYLLEGGQITLTGAGAQFLKNHHFRERMLGLKAREERGYGR
jgi:branched-chain amino acid transport system ATP-binding protein